jgi:transcriptional regulator with XRE-family HTH domain
MDVKGGEIIMPKSTMTEEQVSRFAAWLFAQRDNKKMTQIEMADWLGMSQSHYNAVEKNRKKPTKKMIYQIAKKFNDPNILMQLFGEETVLFHEETDQHLEEPLPFLRYLNTEWQLPLFEEDDHVAKIRDFVSPLRQGVPLKFIKIPPSLFRWGYHQGQYALLRPFRQVEELSDHQLVYWHQGSWETSGLAVVEIKSDKVALRSLESLWSEAMALTEEERDRLQMSNIPHYYPLLFVREGEDYGIYEVTGIFESKPAPLSWPLIPYEWTRQTPVHLIKPLLLTLFSLAQLHEQHIRK